MKTIDLKAAHRGVLGKTGSKALRISNMVPCVVYFNGEATHIQVEYLDLHRVLYSHDTYLVNVQLGEETFQTIVKHADFHPVTDRMTHVEFLKVVEDQKVEVALPVNLTGVAVGVTKGGKLMQKLRKIKVRGYAKDLPASVDINVSAMDLGGNILVKDVPFEGIDVTSPKTASVASVEIPRSLRSQMTKGG